MVRAINEDLTNEAKCETSSKSVSSDLVADDVDISGTNFGYMTFSLANRIALLHNPWYKIEEKVQITRAS